MSNSALAGHPRARTMAHPGPVNPVRIHSRCASQARHLRLLLQPGASLFAGLTEPLRSLGIHSASTTLLGGSFVRLQICVAPPDASGQAMIRYSPPMETGPSYLVFGNATIGKDAQGLPLVHCHAAVRTGRGDMCGGHLVTPQCILAAPLAVLVTALEGFELRVAFDAETNIPLIQPLDVSGRGDLP